MHQLNSVIIEGEVSGNDLYENFFHIKKYLQLIGLSPFDQNLDEGLTIRKMHVLVHQAVH